MDWALRNDALGDTKYPFLESRMNKESRTEPRKVCTRSNYELRERAHVVLRQVPVFAPVP